LHWLTLRSDDEDRVGVLADHDHISALPPAGGQIDIIAGGPGSLRETGEHALKHPEGLVALSDVVLRARRWEFLVDTL